MDHIASGHFDRELGAMTRDPQYAEYTAIEIKAVLTDRITDNMLPEHDYGLSKVYAAIVGGLIVLLGIFITWGPGV
jgi:hypothetical protein